MSDVDEIAKQVSCTDCVNALLHCYGAWHQFDRYYKDGTFDDCTRQRNELVLCGKLKVAGPEEKRVSALLVLRSHLLKQLPFANASRGLASCSYMLLP